jgi:hypothetical protein
MELIAHVELEAIMRRSIFAAITGIGLAAGCSATLAQDVVVETYVASAPRYYSYPPVVYAAPRVVYDAPDVYAPPVYYRVRRYYDYGGWQVPRWVNCESRYRLGVCVLDRSQSGY